MVTMKALIEQMEPEKYGVEHYLHKLMKLAITMTGRGNIYDDYTGAIDIEIGGLTLYSESYYNRVQIIKEEGYEIDIENEDTLRKLADELKKRILAFDRKLKKTKEENTSKIFDKPLDHTFQDELEV